MEPPVRYVHKMTSELNQQDIRDILSVLNSAFQDWGDASVFDWKYLLNPYGESSHLIAYEKSNPVGSVGFWRNDLNQAPAYQCVDLAVVSTHQGRGIFRTMVPDCVERLQGAYLYTFPNVDSRPGFLKQGWLIKRKVPITVHRPSRAFRHYSQQGNIPDTFAEWRFAQHPRKNYYIFRSEDRTFLLTKRRKDCYAIGGVLSGDFGLQEVRPRFLLSYDFPENFLHVPRRIGWLLQNPRYAGYDEFIPSYRSDGW